MKKQYFLNANIVDPANSVEELGGLIINENGKIEGLRIAICGDILHSRVARSNIFLLNMLGAEGHIVAPTNLMPKDVEKFGVKTFSNMKEGVKDCDIVMMLRLQNERMSSSFLS